MKIKKTAFVLAVTMLVLCTADGGTPSQSLAKTDIKGKTAISPEPRIAVQAEETTLYAVPLDEEYQEYLISLGEEKDIDPRLILAVMFVESSYDAETIGDGGESYGLMQVQPKWHGERMEKLGVTDLLNPEQNAAVGVDYLAELIEKYGDEEKALVAYNAGPTGAREHWFSRGLYTSAYSRKVMAEKEKIGLLHEEVQRSD